MSTDGDILRRAQQTPQAFAELFDRHAASVESFLRRRLGVDAAEDALSETFLVAFRRRDAFDPAWESARPWLLGIATRVAAKHRVTEARHWRAVQAAGAAEQRTTSGGVDVSTEQMDAAAAVRALIRRIAALSAKDRDTLFLYAWSDLSADDIAQALAVPVGTVWSGQHISIGGVDVYLPYSVAVDAGGTSVIYHDTGGATSSIPIDDYLRMRETSLHNTDAPDLVLGGFNKTPNYIEIAIRTDSMYFDMGAEWSRATDDYGVSPQAMFHMFNEHALNLAVTEGKIIRFAHNPDAAVGSFLHQEKLYLEFLGYDIVPDSNGGWYAER